MRYPVFLSIFVLVCFLSTGCGDRQPTSAAPPATASQALTPAGVTPAFAECQDDRFRIDLLDALDALPDDTPSAHVDQLLDWVWTVLLARAAGQHADPDLLAGTGKEPLLRDEDLSHLLELPAGRTRAAIGNDGTVYVLVQRSTSEQVHEDVLEAIDHETLFLGEAPKRAEVYGVDLRMERAEAELCRLGTADGTWIRSAAAGFRETRVTSLDGLGQFLAAGVDLLSAQCTENGDGFALEVTGRRRRRAAQAPMAPDHLVALDPIPDELRRFAAESGAQIDRAFAEARAHGVEPGFQTPDPETRRLLDQVLAWKEQYPTTATEDLVLTAHLQRGPTVDLGFSLDPRTDVPEALRRLDQLVAALDRPSELTATLREWDTPPEATLRLAVSVATGDSLGPNRTALATLRDQVRRADALSAERMLLESQELWRDRLAGGLVREVLGHSRYQCARYDGPLQGTEPGMTMFYTDLVAKIWALDWRQAAPTDAVAGFVSVPQDHLSTVYCRDDGDRSYTRIWFGERREGFVRDGPAALRFAPVATRLFARGSAHGSAHGPEEEPSVDMLRFIRWWDSHYTEVAAWEPQYELLNQLVKWTLVRRMTEVAGAPGCLSFLRDAEAGTSQRFDRWREDRDELRWTAPVALLDRSDETTECLPLFESEAFESCGESHWLSGGVGLPDAAALAERPIRVPDPHPSRRRLDPEVASETLPGGGARYPVIERSKGELTDVEVVVSDDGFRLGSGLRSTVSQRASQHARPAGSESTSYVKEIRLRERGHGVEARQELDGFGTLRLDTADLRQDPILLDVEPAEYLQARRLAHDVAARMADSDASLESATTAAAGELPVLSLGESQVAVRLAPVAGSEPAYAVMSSGGGVRGPPSGVRFVAGTPHPPGKGPSGGGLDVVLLRESQAAPYLRDHRARPAASDPVLLTVRENLAKNDFTAARDAVESAVAPPTATAEVAVAAARRGDLVTLERLTDRLIGDPRAVAELRRVHRDLGRLRIELVRQSADRETLDRLEQLRIRLAIATRRLSAPEARRELDRNNGAAKLGGALFATANFPKEAVLPPVSHPPGKRLGPEERFVTEVIDESVRLRDVPPRIEFRGLELLQAERRPLLAHPSSATPTRPASVGIPYRVPPVSPPSPGGGGGGDDDDRVVWPILIVVPCTVDGGAGDPPWLPDCYRDDGSAGSSQSGAEAMRQASEALLACDLNDDGRIDGGGSEQACIQKALEEHEHVLRPYVSR